MAGRSDRATRRTGPRQPSFLGQAVAILLPVLGLAAVGLDSLRQDRALVWQEATQQAQGLAEELADAIWAEVTNPRNAGLPVFHMDRAGQLLFPPPMPLVPTPRPFDVSALNETQRAFWETLPGTLRASSDSAPLLAVAAQLPTLGLPDDLAAVAYLQLGLRLQPQTNPVAAEMFRVVTDKFTNAVGETGLPLAPLARLKLLELAAQTPTFSIAEKGRRLEASCSEALRHPSALTPLLLQRAAELERALGLVNMTQPWRDEWAEHERARALYAAARPHFRAAVTGALSGATAASQTAPDAANVPVPRLFWITTPDASPAGETAQDWLARRFDDAAGFRVVCRTLPDARSPGGREQIKSRLLADAWPVPREEPSWRLIWTDPSSVTLSGSFTSKVELSSRSPGSNAIAPASPFAAGTPDSGQTARRHALRRAPSYFTCSLELAEKPGLSKRSSAAPASSAIGKTPSLSRLSLAHGAADALPILATAVRAEDGIESLRCHVQLASPEKLFHQQRRRAWLFGSLIGVAALTAVAGLLAAWRAFQKQHRLAELKTNFVSSVSHELRAPIASVRLLAEGLERGAVREAAKQQSYYRLIVQECRRLSSLIENVLDFSRIEQGRKQYDFEPTDLAELVRQTVKLMEPAAAEQQVNLAVRIDDPQLSTLNPQPSVDGRAMQQALVNLLDNAVKHSPAGSTVRIGLETSGGEAPSGATDQGKGHSEHRTNLPEESRTAPVSPRIVLWVEDHGCGIPAAEQERIFERFYRVGSELRRETQGVGIGLSIVKHIVDAHGGRVTVQSEVGRGSRFTIELPVRAE